MIILFIFLIVYICQAGIWRTARRAVKSSLSSPDNAVYMLHLGMLADRHSWMWLERDRGWSARPDGTYHVTGPPGNDGVRIAFAGLGGGVLLNPSARRGARRY